MKDIDKILKMVDEQDKKTPEFNNGECGKTCNCALIHVNGDNNKLFTIKGGYMCLKPNIPEIKTGMSIDDHVDRIEALKKHFNSIK